MERITDLHMHVVPKVDDGAADMSMALDMLKLAYEQGARDIFCTSHNAYDRDETERYHSQLTMLQVMAKSKFSDLELHAGCELLCSDKYIDDVLYGLESGINLPLVRKQQVCADRALHRYYTCRSKENCQQND